MGGHHDSDTQAGDKSSAPAEKKASASRPATRDNGPAIRFYSHSQLFYFWPVWLSSLAFAAVTFFSGKTFVIKGGAAGGTSVTMVSQPGLGLAYLIVLVSVIVFTSVNIRGVWAALISALFVILGLVFVLLGWWRPILAAIGGVSFFINLHFYLWMGVVTLLLWLLVVFVYDRRHFIEIRPTQLTIVHEVGDGEKNYDTVGLVFDKQRDNFFQHWVLGLGSGDLIVTTAGGEREQIHFPNVLRISARLKAMHRVREQRGR